ncbi:MAG: MotA/TolQ/ExbB proton channel family protein, partial [Deltaproteobacteria bacterium]
MRILVPSLLAAVLGLAACGSKPAPADADVVAPPQATAPAPTEP